MKFEKIKTDAIPLVDELVYYLKIMCMESVSKNEDEALKYETLESLKKSDLYIACIENRAGFYMFDYTYKDLKNSSLPEYLIKDCLDDKEKIPSKYRQELVAKKNKEYIEHYVELNDYYRMLNGQPPVGDRDLIYVEEYMLTDELKNAINIKVPVHLMPDNEADVLYTFGVIDTLLEIYPHAKYLKYLGSRRISIYSARIAARFVLLRTEPNVPVEVSSRFKDKYEKNRIYTLKAVYSEAFKLGSDYYDNFIQIFILLQTMVDILAEMPDFIIKRDLFDIPMIRLMFEYHGIDFFPEIPYKYQKAMLRNLHRLIKYKSTTKNIVDICSLFGFDNVEVFKFYILRERKVNKLGEYEFYYKDIENEDGTIESVPDNTKNFDLKFLKVPIDDNPDDYIHDKTKYTDYDEIVFGDEYWNGEIRHDIIKNAIIEREFNYLQTKYLSIDTIYSLTEMSFQLTYFYNMIFDDIVVEDLLVMNVPPINSVAKFRFTDILCYLYALMYIYNGVEDDLMDEPEKIMEIKGFNFDADMNALASYVRSQGFTMEELGVDFAIPDGNILTYTQLMDIFTKNKHVYDHLVHEMYNADNKKIYDIYKTIYDSLMINNFSMEFFRKSDGTIAKTYTDFLKDRDLLLYYSLMEIKGIESEILRQERINNLIDDTIYIIETYLESDEFKYLFANLPSISAEAITRYIYKVVNFFKSYKLDVYNINTVYKFDDKLENKVNIIDDLIFNYTYTKQTVVDLLSKLNTTVHLEKEDYIKIIEQVRFEVSYWTSVFLDDKMEINDDIMKIYVEIKKEDCGEVHDYLQQLTAKLYKFSLVHLVDAIRDVNSHLSREDKVKVLEMVTLDLSYWVEAYAQDNIKLNDLISKIKIAIKKNDHVGLHDYLNNMIAEISNFSYLDMHDKVRKSTRFDKSDKFIIIDTVALDLSYCIDIIVNSLLGIKDDVNINSILNPRETIDLYGSFTLFNRMGYRSNLSITDEIKVTRSNE